MGLENIPWLLAKEPPGFYFGLMLAKFRPPHVPRESLNTGTMWFVHSCIAMISPIGVWLARPWVMAGLHAPGSLKAARGEAKP